MNGEQRLVEIVSALDALQIPYLVMGGHAVRYYGFQRETADYDLHIPPTAASNLRELLNRAALIAGGALTETSTWRGEDFRRFVVGRLRNGKEELLEFWLRNHLLDEFENLYHRREEGVYGGRRIAFLSLPDLIRSKETEREIDWQDIAFLEEILDQRNVNAARASGNIVEALSSIRSARGIESASAAGLLNSKSAVIVALRTANPITQAFLLPFAPDVEVPSSDALPSPFLMRLKTVEPCRALHLALVETVRLRYKRTMQERDRRDKNEHLRRQFP